MSEKYKFTSLVIFDNFTCELEGSLWEGMMVNIRPEMMLHTLNCHTKVCSLLLSRRPTTNNCGNKLIDINLLLASSPVGEVRSTSTLFPYSIMLYPIIFLLRTMLEVIQHL